MSHLNITLSINMNLNKMRKKIIQKSIVFFLLILITLNVAFAQPPERGYDYSNPDVYQQPDFYAHSDPAQWDLNQVDWNRVDWTNFQVYWREDIFTRSEPYQQNGFYQNLPDEEYDKLDYKQVDYGNTNLNHDKIDSDKYVTDMGCSNCKMSRFERASVKYSKDGVTHSNGDSVSIPGTYPSGTEFDLMENRIEIRLPEGTTEINIPTDDDVTIDTTTWVTEETETAVVKTSKTREMQYKGNTVEGKLSFKDGQAYVKNGDKATVNSIEIDNAESEAGVNVYFDGERHEGAAVSMNLEKRKMYFGKGLTGSNYKLSFQSGNVFLDTEEADYLTMEPGYNSEITIQHRGEDLIPLVSVKEGKRGVDLILTNGEQRYLVEDGSKLKYFGQYIVGGDQGSVPFTMLLQDEAGNNILGTEKEKEKIIFDNAQNHIIIPENLPQEEFECKDCIIDFGKSRALYDFAAAQVLKRGNIKTITADNAAALYRVSRMLDKIPPEVRESILELKIVPQDQVGAACGAGDVKLGGCANGQTRRIIVGEQTSLSTVYHEAGHTLTYEVEQREKLEIEKPLKEYQLELMRKYGGDWSPKVVYQHPDGISQGLEPCEGCTVSHIHWDKELTTAEEQRMKQLAQSALTKADQSFRASWTATAGDVYGEGLGENIEGAERRISTEWVDGTTGPKNGCVRAYGCNNFYEDVATFVEPVARGDYGFYKPFITPESDQYDPRYRKKLDLLHRYGFITNEDYQKIIGG